MPPEAAAAAADKDTDTNESIQDAVRRSYEALEEANPDPDPAPDPDPDPAPDPDPEPDPDPDPKPDEDPDPDPEPEPEPDPDPTEAVAPEHWGADDKTMFAAQTPEAQEFMLRRHNEMEADYTKKTQDNSELTKEFEPVRAIMAPFAPALAAAGMSNADVIRRWAASENSLNTNPVSAIKQLATFYKVDLSQLNGSQQQDADPYFNGDEPKDNPKVTQLETTVNELQNSIATEAMGRANQQIEVFKATKNDKGDPIYPHFDELIADITQIAAIKRQAGQPIDLAAIYDQAAWANPTTREKLQTSQREADGLANKAKDADAAKKKKEKADKAKAASKSVKSSTDVGAAGGGADNKNSTLRQDVEAAYDKAGDKA